MSKLSKEENNIIDAFYNEKDEKQIINSSEENIKFNKEMNTALNKMDKLNNVDYDLDIDVMKILSKADNIKSKRRERKEFIMFSIIAALIMIFTLIVLVNGYGNVLLYLQITALVIMPLVIIPWAFINKSKEV